MPCSTKYTRKFCNFAANMTYMIFPVNIFVWVFFTLRDNLVAFNQSETFFSSSLTVFVKLWILLFEQNEWPSNHVMPKSGCIHVHRTEIICNLINESWSLLLLVITQSILLRYSWVCKKDWASLNSCQAALSLFLKTGVSAWSLDMK